MDAITLRQFNERIARLVNTPAMHNVWVTAELLDVAVRGGHCYMELIDKDPSTGQTMAKIRGIIWASSYHALSHRFLEATGQQLSTGLKVMLCVSANFHSVFGLSLVISDINPEYTIGDVLRRRRMMIERLQKEGIFDLNRTLPWPDVAQRIAIISAPGAAGYGDFIHQLYTNPRRLRFSTRLFKATMQGDKAPADIIDALTRISVQTDDWDAVVIIRGGGSTSDLATLDNYELASHIAQFPLPIIVGIGHERDITILDYVANMRVKTPTAAAEWLITHNNEALQNLRMLGGVLLQAVTDRIQGSQRQMSFIEGRIPAIACSAIERSRARLRQTAISVKGITSSALRSNMDKLSNLAQAIVRNNAVNIEKKKASLDSLESLLEALSPLSTLKRGYSITRIDGKSIKDVSSIRNGDTITTTLANGTLTSTVN